MRTTHRFDVVDPGRVPIAPEPRSGEAAMPEEVRISVGNWLNRVLADCHVLAALSRKHQRLARSAAPGLSAVLTRHADQQTGLADELADRVHAAGGVAAADPRHIAELTRVPRAPEGAEPVRAMVARLLQGHDIAVRRARSGARVLRGRGDETSADLLDDRVVRLSEQQLQELIDRSVDMTAL